jgi:hypothetical protein
MRRWFLALLTLFVTAQFGWAAAANYCAHERGAQAAQHIGHHAHNHVPGDAHGDEVKSPLPAAELDHGHCHLIHAAIAADGPLGFDLAASSLSYPDRELRSSSHIPEGLDRPQWQRA